MDEHEALAREWVRAVLQLSTRRRSEVRPDQPEGELAPIAEVLAERAAIDLRLLKEELLGGAGWVEFQQRLEESGRLSLDERRILRDRERSDEIVRIIYGKLGKGERIIVPEHEWTMPLAESTWDVLHFLDNQVAYLGPLRQDPQVIYKTAPAAVGGFLGTKGEYTAAVLHAAGARPVVCPEEHGEPSTRPLKEAVSLWLGRFGVAESVETRDLGRLGLELRVRERDVPRPLDLTNVGVGISQLVPVVVMCLNTPPGSLILLEQPELHLHPALQQRLGDFLMACAKSGRQLLVETHSENLVSRLRRRIAEDPSDEMLGYVRLIYAERQAGRTAYREVQPNRYGVLEDWPEGFFDQTAKESQEILRAGVRKQRVDQVRSD